MPFAIAERAMNGVSSLLGHRVETEKQTFDNPVEAELVQLVESNYEYARQAKLPMLETWVSCLAFVAGDQWKRWEPAQRRLVQPGAVPEHRILPIYNQLPAIIDSTVARLIQTRQLPRCRPDESDEEDAENASKGTHCLRGWFHKADVDLAEHKVNVQRVMFGAGFYHLQWDPGALAKVPQMDPFTGMAKKVLAPVGDVSLGVRSVFDVFPQPCRDYDDAEWVIVSCRKPLAWFRRTFPERGLLVEADRGAVEDVFGALIGETTAASTLRESSPSSPPGEGLATLKIFYEKPSGQFTRGRTVMVAGSRLMFAAGELPLEFVGTRNPLPVKMIPFRYLPERLWPKGLVEECISPQRELNRGLGSLSQHIRTIGVLKWIIPKNSVTDPKAVNNQAKEIIYYTGTTPPQIITPPSLPAQTLQYGELQRNELRHLSGLHEVAEGQVPSGVSAASAIALLQNAEAQRISSPGFLGKKALEDTFKHVLVVQDARYREDRLLTVPERGGGGTTQPVRGGSFGPLEVVVELTSGGEDNDSAKFEVLLGWINAGLWQLISDPRFAGIFIRVLREIGQGWLADILQQGSGQVAQGTMLLQAMQASQMQDQAATEQQGQLAAGEQQQQGAMQQQALQMLAQMMQGEDQMGLEREKLRATQQQGQDERFSRAAEQQQGQSHELEMARRTAAQAMEQARIKGNARKR